MAGRKFERVLVLLVEVGLGGRLDATNIVKDPIVTVLTKIGMDHTDFLGDTIEKIAREKAGIMKANAPCVVDASNNESALQVIRAVKEEVGAGELILAGPEADGTENMEDKPLTASTTLVELSERTRIMSSDYKKCSILSKCFSDDSVFTNSSIFTMFDV